MWVGVDVAGGWFHVGHPHLAHPHEVQLLHIEDAEECELDGHHEGLRTGMDSVYSRHGAE